MAREFRILGPLEVVADGRVVALGGAKQRTLLALLLVRAKEPVSVDVLAEALWDDGPPPTAAKMIQGYVSQLRKALGDGVLVTRPSGYLLAVADDELAGRAFLRSFGSTQPSRPQPSYAAAYAAQATEVLLAAIARSDGTRASVTKELFASDVRNGILGSFRFTPDGDMTPTPVTGSSASSVESASTRRSCRTSPAR
jgi:hypothetical protein